uniref:Uncharacterized protein n=1 Tax=Ciona savignyi TaxID=51511 RepID=H2YB74_CIOSA
MNSHMGNTTIVISASPPCTGCYFDKVAPILLYIIVVGIMIGVIVWMFSTACSDNCSWSIRMFGDKEQEKTTLLKKNDHKHLNENPNYSSIKTSEINFHDVKCV